MANEADAKLMGRFIEAADSVSKILSKGPDASDGEEVKAQPPFALPAGATLATYRKMLGGQQAIVEFPNGRGASVVQHRGSYGSEAGLWELAVLNKRGGLDYSTPITSDVEGHLSVPAVEDLLARIAALPPEAA